jgi:hypothetical protein
MKLLLKKNISDAGFKEYDIISCEIRMPISGIWIADLVVDTLEDIGENYRYKISNNYSVVFNGTKVRGSFFKGVYRLRLKGCRGDLNKILQPKSYSGCTLKTILMDILSACGDDSLADVFDTTETNINEQYRIFCAGSVDQSILSKWFIKYVRIGQKTAEATIDQLLSDAGAESWRFSPASQKLSIYKTENWYNLYQNLPDRNDQINVEKYNSEDGFADINYENNEYGLFILPGMIIRIPICDGNNTEVLKKISYVIHSSEQKPKPRLRSRIYFTDEDV